MMRKPSYIYPLFKLTANNIRRHPVINLISISIIAVAMLLLSFYFLAYSNAARIVSDWRSDLKVIVYLDDDISADRLAALKSFCRDLDEVVSLTYVTREEARERFRKILGDDQGFLDDLPENPLPASLELVLDAEISSLDDVARLARQLERQVGVAEVVYGSRWLRHLFSLLRVVKYFGLLFAAFLSLMTVFIVASTIRLSLFSRREIIRVLYLVGANRWFVAMPHLLEGVFQGTLASLLALGLAYGGFLSFRDWLHAQVPQWPIAARLEFFPLPFIFVFLGLGTCLGIAGFLLSSRWNFRD